MWTKIVRFVALNAVAVGGVIGNAAHAQILWPLPPPTPPLPQLAPAPAGVQLANFNGTTAVTIRWFQPEYLSLRQSTPATHFAVCARAPGVTCEWPLTPTAGVFAGTATGSIFTRTPVYSAASPFLQNPVRILTGYNYSATLTLDNSYFDKQLKWSVAACASAVASSCIAAVGNSIWYTTKELVGDVYIRLFAGEVTVTAEGVNLGTSPAHTFWNSVVGYPALIGASGTCAIDPNEQRLGVTNQTQLILATGQTLLAGTIFNGTRYNTSGLTIVGMSNAVPVSTTGMTIAANPLQPQTDPEVKTDLASRSLAVGNIYSNSMIRYGMVGVAKVDYLGQVTEVNEGDNVRVECKTFAY